MAGQLPEGFIPDAPAAAAGPIPEGFIPDQPTFRTTNARDASGAPSLKPTVLDLGVELVKGMASGVNPIPVLKAMYGGTAPHYEAAKEAAKRGDYATMFGENLKGAIAPGVTVATGIARSHWEQLEKAKKAFDDGRYSESVAHTAAALIPFIGPMAAQAGEDIGTGDPRTMARGIGEGIVAARPQLPGEVLGKVAGGVARGAAAVTRESIGKVRLNPAEAAANAAGEAAGVPLDAATATGSRTFRAMQKQVANSAGGEGVASRMLDEQRTALSKWGDRLADDANAGGGRVGPVEAGEGVQGSIRQLITDLHDEANRQYTKVRELEKAPEHTDTVEKTPTMAERNSIIENQRKTLGYHPDGQELGELKSIREEMRALPYVKRTWNEAPRKSGNAGGGDYDITPGAAGAPVYDDIVQAAGSGMTRAEVVKSLDVAIEGGAYNKVARAALEVAQKRIAGDKTVTPRSLPPDAGAYAPRESAQMQMAVDLTEAKRTLQPVYDRLKREADLAPLMGGKADALRALDRVVNGPDTAPLSQVDAALGDLKALARGGKRGPAAPELRGAGPGTAAYAVAQLEKAVGARAAAAGPEFEQALQGGRAATKAKYDVARVLEQLRAEPERAFEQLTAPRDGNIKFLKAVRDVSPAQMPNVARAWLERALDMAREQGGFGRVDRLFADWQRLGSDTKAILFPSPGQAQALDHFFLLAKRLGENPNPSGTAHNLRIFNLATAPASNALARILYTKDGVSALTRWMSTGQVTRVGGQSVGVVGPKARAAAWAGVVTAGKRAGVALPASAPMAADADEQR